MNKLIRLTPIILLVALIAVSSVRAEDALLISGYGTANYNGHYHVASSTHPTTSASYYSAIGQTVMLNASYQVGTFQVYGYIAYTTPCNGTLTAQIYNNTDNELLNVPSTDIGYVAESWNTVELDLYEGTTSPGWWNFYFDNVTLSAGNYTFAVVCTYAGYTANGVTLRVGVDNTAPTDAGQFVAYYSSQWNALASEDMISNVYTFVDTSPTATPTPTATTAPTGDEETNALIDTFTDYLIPLILFLLPAIILGWLTHWAKWPILIGLAIGAGLTYLFMGTEYLWLVILVVIGIGASAYQSSRGG